MNRKSKIISMITYDSGGSETMEIIRKAMVNNFDDAIIDMNIHTDLAQRKVKEGEFIPDIDELVYKIKNTKPDLLIMRVTDNVNREMIEKMVNMTKKEGIPVLSLVDVFTDKYSSDIDPEILCVPNEWAVDFMGNVPYKVVATGNPAYDGTPKVNPTFNRHKDTFKIFYPSQPYKMDD